MPNLNPPPELCSRCSSLQVRYVLGTNKQAKRICFDCGHVDQWATDPAQLKVAQQFLRAQGHKISIDGVLGQLTIDAANAWIEATQGAINGRHRQTPSPSQSSPAQAPGAVNYGALSQLAQAQAFHNSNALANALNGAYAQSNAGSALAQQLASIANHPGLGSYQKTPVEDAGITAGEIIAWRCWRLDGGYLKAAIVDDVWAPGEPMQKHEGSMSPAQNGIHAWKTKAQAIQYGKHDNYVLGSVMLWGEVIEHEKGYLAEYAAVNSIDDIFGSMHDKKAMIEALRARYDVGGDNSYQAFPTSPPHRYDRYGDYISQPLPITQSAALVSGPTNTFPWGLTAVVSAGAVFGIAVLVLRELFL